jgi:signal transduction histidine kinase
MISMRERADRLGGTDYVSSTPGHGASVAARMQALAPTTSIAG